MQQLSFFHSPNIVDRTRDGHETVGNIKAVSIDSFKELEVANIVGYATN